MKGISAISTTGLHSIYAVTETGDQTEISRPVPILFLPAEGVVIPDQAEGGGLGP